MCTITIDQLLGHISAYEKEAACGPPHLAENLSFVKKVCEEFFSLCLPLSSEILDVAAGSGVVSANIQARGYCSVDALDGDMDTLRKLQERKLYRNFICR